MMLAALAGGPTASGDVILREARDTLTAVEMDHGDELRFTLRSGRTVSLQLEDTQATILSRVRPGGIVYRFSCHVRVDGQPMTLQRFTGAQECFYEPYVVAGLRIWPDTVKAVYDLIPIRYPKKGNLQCLPRKAARLAVQDASLRICPQETRPWLENEPDFIDVGRCYNGDDCYLGAYLGQACHVGMDIDHPKGSRLTAPIDFDTQAYFNSLKMGDNNNRWRGIRRWPNGDVWALQTHHLIKLLVPQNTPLGAGVPYATTAGVRVGSHEHTHFEFKIGRKNPDGPLPASGDPKSIACPVDFQDESEVAQKVPEALHLDPWIVFWQTFEDARARRGDIRAGVATPGVARTGQSVAFSAEASRAGGAGRTLSYFWTFGDGGFADVPERMHVFAEPGIHPVTLIVDDGEQRVATTHHVCVSGEPVKSPVLALAAPDEPSFRVRPACVADVYGWPVRPLPHTLQFVVRASRPVPDAKTIVLQNLGGGVLPAAKCTGTPRWLTVAPGPDPRRLTVTADGTGLAPGRYRAKVRVACPGAANSPQPFCVELDVREGVPQGSVTVDDRDAGFYATPYFWVGHRFCRRPASRRGHNGFCLSNGGQPRAGEFVRFTPDLRAGAYVVALSDATPFHPGTEFDVRVRHLRGETTVRVDPGKSRRVGVFEFPEGADGYVEILAGGSKGRVIADAVVFALR